MAIANVLTWNRNPGEFATRVVLSREKLAEKHCDIVVEHATQALFFKNGIFLQALEPGRHTTMRIQDRIFSTPAQVVIIWVDCAAIREIFEFDNVRSNDNIPLRVSIQLHLRLRQPSLFCANVLKQKKHYSKEELNRYFYRELRNGTEEFIALRPAMQATGNRSFKDDFELSLRENLRNFFDNDGFELVQLRAAHFCNPDLETLRDFSGQVQIERQRSRLELEKNQDQLDRDRLLAASNLQRDILDIAHYKKKALLSCKLKKIQDQEHIAKSKQQVRLEHSLQAIESERERQNNVAWVWKKKRQDREMVKKFGLLKKQQQQRQYLEKLQLEHEIEMERVRAQRCLEVNREKFVGTWQVDELREIAEEQSKRRKLKGTMERRKFQVAMETDIAKMALKTQKKRAETALSIREKIAALDFKNACYRLQLSAMGRISEREKILDVDPRDKHSATQKKNQSSNAKWTK